MTTIGVEEEFVLLHPGTLTPVAKAAEARQALHRADFDGAVMSEFFPSQLEYASPVCETTAQAQTSLAGFRRDLSTWAEGRGLLAASVGLPYQVMAEARVTPEERYQKIAAHFGAIVPDHQLNGLHVHIGVADRDQAVRASNRLRPWLPVLLALSANSPYWRGVDTGFDSWRAIHSRRWTTFGIPPRFRDAADYDRRARTLHGIGGTSDAGTLNWVVRPSERYPTVEVRVFDAQLDAETSVALAALVRGLVATDGDADGLEQELLDAALWHSARNGLNAELVSPNHGRLEPAADVVRAVVREAADLLAEQGDLDLVTDAIERILTDGNGAARQRRAMNRGGTRALAELIRDAGVSGCGRLGTGLL